MMDKGIKNYLFVVTSNAVEVAAVRSDGKLKVIMSVAPDRKQEAYKLYCELYKTLRPNNSRLQY